MAANVLRVDPLVSYAHREGDLVRVVLSLPTANLGRPHAGLIFQGAGERVRVRAEVREDARGVQVVGRVQASELADGIWRLKLRLGPKAPMQNLRTRLLVNARQPIALLPRFDDSVVGT